MTNDIRIMETANNPQISESNKYKQKEGEQNGIFNKYMYRIR